MFLHSHVLVNWAFYFEIQHNKIEQLINIIEIHVMTLKRKEIYENKQRQN
jgi:hypothetical protein